MLKLRLPFVVLVLVLALVPGAAAASSDLFFSEYVEGSSNNKALEIFNDTGSAVDLTAGGYNVQMYFNGSTTAGLTINLAGTVADDDVFVLAQASASPAILAVADQTNGAGWFNGDDAVVLRKGTTVLDVIGQTGFDPGSEWGTGLTSTADNTLRRKASVTAGDVDGTNSFDPSVEWDGFATDTFDGLGSHSVGGGDSPPSVSATTPASGAAGVPLGANVQISFSEPVDVGGAWFSISCGTSGAHTATVSGGPTTFTLDPDTDFATAESCTVAVVAAQVTDQDAEDPPNAMAADFAFSFATATPPVAIHTIQGAGHRSTLAGTFVSGVAGIVTAKASNAFWMQDPAADSDDATSEAIFVFTSSAPSVLVGDAVSVAGTVTEFRPGGASSTNLTTTELTGPTVAVRSSGNALPAATVIGTGGRVPPGTVIDDDAAGSVETSGVFEPASDGIDFYESLEAMRVQVNAPVAVGPRNDFGEIPVVGDGGSTAALRTLRGGVIVRPTDFNPERIHLDDTLLPTPAANVRDGFAEPAVGVLDYSFGNFKLNVIHAPTVVPSGLARETTAPPGAGQLALATLNVENLDPADPPAKFAALAGLIAGNLAAPDLISLEEVQDDNGPVNDSVVTATQTLQQLVQAVQAAGGPTYAFRVIDPVDDQDGGEPGGNIRVAFLFRTDRGLAFVDRPGGTSTAATTVVGSGAGTQLSFSPGRIDPTNPAFNSSRKPLAGEFTFHGAHLFVVANHFNSKGGDQPLFGRFQPPVRSSEVQRHQQAQIVNGFVDAVLAADPNANVAVLGDLNDFDFSETLSILEGGVLTNLYDTLPASERYSYVFEGNSQALDHVLLSDNAFADRKGLDVVHVNAEFAEQSSDHDPLVARICADATPPTLEVTATPNRLWPPNHKYVDVTTVTSANDSADPAPVVTFVSATSSEPDNAPGGSDGNTVNDVVVVGPRSFRLRAERDETGSGRTYTLTYRATDACGNSRTASAGVRVPLSQSNG